MRRTFAKGDQVRHVDFPSSRDWKRRADRMTAQRTVATLRSRGWSEVTGNGQEPQAKPVTPVQADDEIAIAVAETLPADPNWNDVFNQLGEYGLTDVIDRRRVLRAIQKRHLDQCDSAERMKRVKEMAEKLRQKAEQISSAGIARKQEDEAMAKVLAARPRPTVSGEGRQIDFGSGE